LRTYSGVSRAWILSGNSVFLTMRELAWLQIAELGREKKRNRGEEKRRIEPGEVPAPRLKHEKVRCSGEEGRTDASVNQEARERSLVGGGGEGERGDSRRPAPVVERRNISVQGKYKLSPNHGVPSKRGEDGGARGGKEKKTGQKASSGSEGTLGLKDRSHVCAAPGERRRKERD